MHTNHGSRRSRPVAAHGVLVLCLVACGNADTGGDSSPARNRDVVVDGGGNGRERRRIPDPGRIRSRWNVRTGGRGGDAGAGGAGAGGGSGGTGGTTSSEAGAAGGGGASGKGGTEGTRRCARCGQRQRRRQRAPRDRLRAPGACSTPPAPSPLIGWAAVSAMMVDSTTGAPGRPSPSPRSPTSRTHVRPHGHDRSVKGNISGDVTMGSNKTIVGLCGAEIHGTSSCRARST